MIKKRKIIGAYKTEAFCDKCGAPLRPTGVCLTSFPAQYPYRCTNEECDGGQAFWEHELPGSIIYEFADEYEEVEN